MNYIEVESSRELLRKLLDVFCSIHIQESLWLTPKEKEYFLECAMLNARGVDLIEKEAVDYLSSLSNFPNKSVYIYKDKLKKKGWIIQTIDGIIIHPDFDFRKKKIPEKITLHIPLIVKTETL